MTQRKVCAVPPNLRRSLEPVDGLRHLAHNPRRGDVDAIRDSLRRFGQYKPIVARRQTGEVLVGNHTLAAARAEGWTHVAVLWRDEPSDVEAERLAIADNRIPDLGGYDEAELAAALQRLDGDGGLHATGYRPDDLQGLLFKIDQAAPAPPDGFADPEDGMTTDYRCPQCAYEWSGLPKPTEKPA